MICDSELLFIEFVTVLRWLQAVVVVAFQGNGLDMYFPFIKRLG